MRTSVALGLHSSNIIHLAVQCVYPNAGKCRSNHKRQYNCLPGWLKSIIASCLCMGKSGKGTGQR